MAVPFQNFIPRGFEPSRVVVTGIGVVTPLGIGLTQTWQRLLEGATGTVRLNESHVPSGHWTAAQKLPCQVVAPVDTEELKAVLSIALGGGKVRHSTSAAEFAHPELRVFQSIARLLCWSCTSVWNHQSLTNHCLACSEVKCGLQSGARGGQKLQHLFGVQERQQSRYIELARLAAHEVRLSQML